MACHAVPRVMMYQGDAHVPLEAKSILCGLRWWRTEVWNNGCCFVRLERCGIVIWCLIAHYYYWGVMTGERPPSVQHCYLVHDTSTRLLYVPHVSKRKYWIHESKRRRRSTRHGLVFAASCDPSIETRTKKGEGRKGNTQIKVERLSFGKIWFYEVRTHYAGSTTYYSLLFGL